MRTFIVVILLLIGSVPTIAQSDSTQLPYKRFPTVPPLKLLLSDSTTKFTKEDLSKKKPVLLMIFSPECDHCKHETEAIIQHIDDLKKVQIVMATLLPYSNMKAFYDHYELKKYDNIVVGKDLNYMLPAFYGIHNMPYLAFYDKKGNLIKTFEGAMKIEDVIETFK